MKRKISSPIFILVALLSLPFVSGCSTNEPDGAYYFKGFKIFSNGFIWGEMSAIPVSGDVADSSIYYRKETENSKEIRIMVTGDVSSFFEQHLPKMLETNID